jgi:hypothetical protein
MVRQYSPPGLSRGVGLQGPSTEVLRLRDEGQARGCWRKKTNAKISNFELSGFLRRPNSNCLFLIRANELVWELEVRAAICITDQRRRRRVVLGIEANHEVQRSPSPLSSKPIFSGWRCSHDSYEVFFSCCWRCARLYGLKRHLCIPKSFPNCIHLRNISCQSGHLLSSWMGFLCYIQNCLVIF